MVSNGKSVKELKSVSSPLTVEGKSFKAVFDNTNGQLSQLEYDGKAMIEPGKGLRLDAFRAFVNNDNWVCRQLVHQRSSQPPAQCDLVGCLYQCCRKCCNLVQCALSGSQRRPPCHRHSAGKQVINELTDTPSDFAFDVNEILYCLFPTDR